MSVFWVVLVLGCGTVKRGEPCIRDGDCAELRAACVVWLNAAGEGQRTCEIPCSRRGDCPDGESCAPVYQPDVGICVAPADSG